MKVDGVCICPGNVPVCPDCGRKWEVRINYTDNPTYTSKEVLDRCRALYGSHFLKDKVTIL